MGWLRDREHRKLSLCDAGRELAADLGAPIAAAVPLQRPRTEERVIAGRARSCRARAAEPVGTADGRDCLRSRGCWHGAVGAWVPGGGERGSSVGNGLCGWARER